MHFTQPRAFSPVYGAIVFLAFTTSDASGKGGGVGYWLEGTITSVNVVDNRVELIITGRLTLDQYAGSPSTRQSVHYECAHGISASLVQWQSFFVMSADWRGGALRGGGELARLAQVSEKRGNVIKLELLNPKIDFADWQCPNVQAEVIRATDPELK
jgi:flagellin-like protein